MTVSGEQPRGSTLHIHVSILPYTPLPSRLSHNLEQSSVCYTVGPCWLSILNIAVCTWTPFLKICLPAWVPVLNCLLHRARRCRLPPHTHWIKLSCILHESYPWPFSLSELVDHSPSTEFQPAQLKPWDHLQLCPYSSCSINWQSQ